MFKQLTPVQEKKFLWWFQALDADHDGQLNHEDFFDYLYKWDSLFALDGKPAFRDILFRMQDNFWTALTDCAGAEQITKAQWLDFLDRLVKEYRTAYVVDEVMPAEKWGKLLFELMDEENINQATQKNYSRYILSLAFHNANIENAWHKLDPEDTGYMDLDCFLKRLKEFWLSSDLSEPGNYLLAPPADWFND